MRLLWLCNVIPGAIRQAMGNPGGSGLWMDHVLSDLRRDPGLEIRILCRGGKASSGSVAERLSYVVFEEPVAYTCFPGSLGISGPMRSTSGAPNTAIPWP